MKAKLSILMFLGLAKVLCCEGADTIRLFGTAFGLDLGERPAPVLENTSESSVVAAWDQFQQIGFEKVALQCLRHKEEKRLCDWAFVGLTREVAGHCCGAATNEAALLQTFLLAQAGYQVRLAKASERLCPMLASTDELLQLPFVVVDDVRYYVYDKSLGNKPLLVFNRPSGEGRPLTMAVVQPRLAVVLTEERTLVSRRQLEVGVRTNRNLIDYYGSLPRCTQWRLYKEASISDEAKATLWPALRQATNGLDTIAAVNVLLDFVQTAFAYRDDRQQFGSERPLYPDETLFYPYSDCDDRAILFACLVEELAGLETVFLKWPNHVAVGVAFSQAIDGDAVEYGGKRYAVCDPTCIGAEAGRCPKKYKDVMPTIR